MSTFFSRILRVFILSALYFASTSFSNSEEAFSLKSFSHWGDDYNIRRLTSAAFVFSNSTDVFLNVPKCMSGYSYIQTPNSAKFRSADDPLFNIRSSVAVAVYVAFDNRSVFRPKWLKEHYKKTELDELSSGPIRGNSEGPVVYDIYRAEFAPGVVEFNGGSLSTNYDITSMYTALVVPAKNDRCRIGQ